MNKFTPLIKGIITSVVMVILSLSLYYSKLPVESKLHYAIYILYAIGIVWTLIAYSHSASFTGKFSDLFAQGFKCFIVVTLIIVLFYGIFNYQHPEFAEETAKAYREQLIDGKQKMPAEIESEVATFKKQYTLKLVSKAIFGYLIFGTFITAAGSALLMRRK